MKLRPARLGMLLAGTLALLATLVPPASADTYKTVATVGTMVFSGCSGFGYPRGVVLPPATKPGAKPGTVVANIPPQGTH